MEIDTQNKKKKTTVLILIGVFIVGVVAIPLFILRNEKMKQASNLQKKAENADYQADTAYGDFNSELAIQGYERVVNMESDREVQAVMKIKISRVYLSSSKPEDKDKGLNILMGIITDKTLSAQRRAEAVTVMLVPYFVTHESDYPQKLYDLLQTKKDVFGEVTKNWNPSDIRSTKIFFFKDIQNFINGEFENSLAYYRIGSWYGSEVLDNESMSPEERDKFLLEIKNNLEKGDRFLGQLDNNSGNDYSDSIIEWFSTTTRHIRFFDYLVLARFDEKLAEKARENYDNLFALYNKESYGKAKLRLEGYTRFYYAAYLAEKYGDARKDEVAEVIAPVISKSPEAVEANSQGVWNLFNTVKENPACTCTGNHTKDFLLAIAAINDDFSAFLKEREIVSE